MAAADQTHPVFLPLRLCEFPLITRDTWHLLGAGALALAGSLFYILGVYVSIDSHALLPMLIAGPIGGMLALPQICGVADTVLRSLRGGASGSWWQSYRRAWRQNVRGCLLPGFLGGLLFGFQLFIFAHFTRLDLDLFLLFAMALGLMLSVAIASWLLPQLALIELPLGRAVVNAMLLCLRHPLKTLGAVALQLLYWSFLVLALPRPVLAGLELENDPGTGYAPDGRSILEALYLGRRALWDAEQRPSFAADEALWLALTEGAKMG